MSILLDITVLNMKSKILANVQTAIQFLCQCYRTVLASGAAHCINKLILPSAT